MRKILAAAVVVSCALALVGCGGGGGGTAQNQNDNQAPAQQPAAPAGQQAPGTVDRSPVETPTLVPFPSKLSTALPESIQSKLDAGRPMLIFFYDSAEPETKQQRAEIDAVLAEYRGLIDLVTFDVKSPSSGPASDSVRRAAALASDLDVTGTPYIIVVDSNGFLTWRWLGFVDRDVIEREVLRATE
ncbi:MAG: hypothetical protein N3B11_05680 [Coriobacteriia bacterium]|nr:hypothetical protein [Coriobacteriia bacterium]